MKGLVLLGEGFEISEALTPIDIYFRAGIKMVKASFSDTLFVKSQENIIIKCDDLIDNIDYREFDFLFIPGGKASFTVLENNLKVKEIIDYFVMHQKLVTAICAAPHLIGKYSYLKNRKFTCFPSFEKYVIDGIYLEDQGVVEDGNFITAKSVYYSVEFALCVVKHLISEEKTKEVYLKIRGE